MPNETETTEDKAETLTAEERLKKVVSFVWRGLHNAPKIKKENIGNGLGMWELNTSPLATYDFDGLTRLVLAAHKYAVRAEIDNGGPRRIKVRPWARKREGDMTERHPTIRAGDSGIRKQH